MKEYLVTRGGIEFTMRLNADTAKKWNARPVAEKPKAKAPRNKSRTPSNK